MGPKTALSNKMVDMGAKFAKKGIGGDGAATKRGLRSNKKMIIFGNLLHS